MAGRPGATYVAAGRPGPVLRWCSPLAIARLPAVRWLPPRKKPTPPHREECARLFIVASTVCEVLGAERRRRPLRAARPTVK